MLWVAGTQAQLSKAGYRMNLLNVQIHPHLVLTLMLLFCKQKLAKAASG